MQATRDDLQSRLEKLKEKLTAAQAGSKSKAAADQALLDVSKERVAELEKKLEESKKHAAERLSEQAERAGMKLAEQLKRERAKLGRLQHKYDQLVTTTGKEREGLLGKVAEMEAELAATTAATGSDLKKANRRVAQLEKKLEAEVAKAKKTATAHSAEVKLLKARIAQLEQQLQVVSPIITPSDRSSRQPTNQSTLLLSA